MADGGAMRATGYQLDVPLLGDYVLLARDMRSDEIAQWQALTGRTDYNPDILARAFAAQPGPAHVLLHNGLPILLGGMDMVRPGVCEGWMIGTDAGWAAHWRQITKWARRLLDGALSMEGCHRVQLHALESRRQAHVWYERGLGMTCEGVQRAWFADGQNAVVFARVKGD